MQHCSTANLSRLRHHFLTTSTSFLTASSSKSDSDAIDVTPRKRWRPVAGAVWNPSRDRRPAASDNDRRRRKAEDRPCWRERAAPLVDCYGGRAATSLPQGTVLGPSLVTWWKCFNRRHASSHVKEHTNWHLSSWGLLSWTITRTHLVCSKTIQHFWEAAIWEERTMSIITYGSTKKMLIDLDDFFL